MKTLVLTTMAAVILGGTAAVAAAQPMERERGGRPDLATLQRELGLSDEQATQLRGIWGEGRKAAIRRHADLAIARMDLEEALEAPTVDEKLVASRVRAVSDLQAAAIKARVDQRLALRKVLTPEQQQKMRSMRGRLRDVRQTTPRRRTPRRMGGAQPPDAAPPDAPGDSSGPGR